MAVVSIEPLLYFFKRWESPSLLVYPLAYGAMVHAADAAEHPAEMIDHYLGLERFTCCDMQVGFEIRVDGQSWTDHAADHFWCMGSWLVTGQGLTMQAQQTLRISFGDQAFDAYLERDHDIVRLMPPLWQDKAVMLEAPFEPFMVQFRAAYQDFIKLVGCLQAEVLSRGYDEAELQNCLEGQGDKPYPAIGDTKMRLAVMWRELHDNFPMIE